MNKNDMSPLPTNTHEWFFNRNSIIILLDIVLFVVLYNTLPYEPKVVMG
ncbi:di-and tricarboxylate transporter [Klebsiella michiganensis]|nr:di-and tricarboxylate transporter [Klebsiella michiganensis]